MNKHYLTDGSGGCLESGTWSKDQASCECDPSQAKCQAAPEPAPVAEAAPAPVAAAVVKDISLGASALFDVNKASLKPAGMAELDKLADDLNSMTSVESIQIVGHTDSTGEASYNQMLSEKRANAVRDYLAGKGVDPALMTTSGMGETQPIADNATRDGRAQNRRVEIEIKGSEVQ